MLYSYIFLLILCLASFVCFRCCPLAFYARAIFILLLMTASSVSCVFICGELSPELAIALCIEIGWLR